MVSVDDGVAQRHCCTSIVFGQQMTVITDRWPVIGATTEEQRDSPQRRHSATCGVQLVLGI